MVEVKVTDVYAVQSPAAHIVLLKTKRGETFLPIWIGQSEALAISLRLARQAPPRPLTHDLLERILDRLRASISKIHIEDLREHVFIGRIFLKHKKKTVQIDSRPSDSIALAVGARAPIFVAKAVLARAGMTDGEFRSKFRDRRPPSANAPTEETQKKRAAGSF